MSYFRSRRTRYLSKMDDVTELNRRLEEHSTMLLNDSREYAKIAREAVEARNTLDLARARALLTIKEGTVDFKKAQATLLCESQMIAARIAEAHLDALQTRLKSVSASLTAVQSQCRLLKTESDLNNYRT